MFFQEYKHKPNKEMLIIQPMVGSCLGHVVWLFFFGGLLGQLVVAPEDFIPLLCFFLVMISILYVSPLVNGSEGDPREPMEKDSTRRNSSASPLGSSNSLGNLGKKRPRFRILKRGKKKLVKSLRASLPKLRTRKPLVPAPEAEIRDSENGPGRLSGDRIIITPTSIHMGAMIVSWDELEAVTYIPGETGRVERGSGDRAVTPGELTFKVNGVELPVDFPWGLDGGEIQSFRPLDEKQTMHLIEQFHAASSEAARADLIKEFHEHPESAKEQKKIHPKLLLGSTYLVLGSLITTLIVTRWDIIW
jgi:hypothetical protein